MGDPQVTMGFNIKSWSTKSNDLDDLGVPPMTLETSIDPRVIPFSLFSRSFIFVQNGRWWRCPSRGSVIGKSGRLLELSSTTKITCYKSYPDMPPLDFAPWHERWASATGWGCLLTPRSGGMKEYPYIYIYIIYDYIYIIYDYIYIWQLHYVHIYILLLYYYISGCEFQTGFVFRLQSCCFHRMTPDSYMASNWKLVPGWSTQNSAREIWFWGSKWIRPIPSPESEYINLPKRISDNYPWFLQDFIIEWANALVPPTPFQGRPPPCQCQCHGWEGCSPAARWEAERCWQWPGDPGSFASMVRWSGCHSQLADQSTYGHGGCHAHSCPVCSTVVWSSQSCGRIVVTHVTPSGKRCQMKHWHVPDKKAKKKRKWNRKTALAVGTDGNGKTSATKHCPNKRGLCAGKGQAAMLECWRPGAWWKLPRGMCRQRAGCNPGAAKADGQRALWKLPRGNWRVLRVLRAWSLANGRLECPNKRGLCAGKGQAARLECWRPGAWLPRGMCRQRAGCNPGAAKAGGQRAWWKLPRGNWRVFRGLKPGKRQARMP